MTTYRYGCGMVMLTEYTAQRAESLQSLPSSMFPVDVRELTCTLSVVDFPGELGVRGE